MRGGARQVKYAVAVEGAAVVDADDDFATVGEVGYFYFGAERQFFVCCGQFVHVVGFAVSGLASMEGVAVPGCRTLLFKAFAVGQGLVTFAEYGVAVAFAAAAFGVNVACFGQGITLGIVVHQFAQVGSVEFDVAQLFFVVAGEQRTGFGFLGSFGFLGMGKIDHFNDIHLLFCGRRSAGFVRRDFRMGGKAGCCDTQHQKLFYVHCLNLLSRLCLIRSASSPTAMA